MSRSLPVQPTLKSKSSKKMSNGDIKKGFLVRFIDIGTRHLAWEERIERPVTDTKIVKAIKRRKALASNEIETAGDSDYGGIILAEGREAGRYLIVPGSNR